MHVSVYGHIFDQTSSVGEAQKLVVQAADLLTAIHSSIQHGIQSQNDTTKGGNTHNTHTLLSCRVKHIDTHTHTPHMLRIQFDNYSGYLCYRQT